MTQGNLQHVTLVLIVRAHVRGVKKLSHWGYSESNRLVLDPKSIDHKTAVSSTSHNVQHLGLKNPFPTHTLQSTTVEPARWHGTCDVNVLHMNSSTSG